MMCGNISILFGYLLPRPAGVLPGALSGFLTALILYNAGKGNKCGADLSLFNKVLGLGYPITAAIFFSSVNAINPCLSAKFTDTFSTLLKDFYMTAGVVGVGCYVYLTKNDPVHTHSIS